MRITVETLDDLDRVLLIARRQFELSGPQDVIVKDHQNSRSLAQNNLLWKWLGEISKETGQSDTDLHDIYKEKYLCGIFIRDDEEYAEMAHAVKLVKDVDPAKYKSLRKWVIAETSTTNCSVKQFTEYLNKIKEHAVVGLRITLTEPSMQGLI